MSTLYYSGPELKRNEPRSIAGAKAAEYPTGYTSEVFEPKTFSALREQLDPDWITQALEATDTVTVRRRRLPAEEMIWSVIGMALLRDRTIADVARSLSLDGRGPKKLVSASAVSQARSRLGKEPLAWLFCQSAKVWAHKSADQDRFKGLALYGVDGTSLRVPDTPGNAERFGYSKSVRGESAYPLVRLVALMALRSHVIAAAAFGSYAKGEHSYAQSLWQELPDNSLCIVDRGFFSAKLLLGIHDVQKNKHWLIRLKSNAQIKTLETLGPDDVLVEIEVSSEARRKDPALPLHYTARAITYQRPGFKPQRVLTSLTDHTRYPAALVTATYHERWELELGYDEITLRVQVGCASSGPRSAVGTPPKTDLLDRRESIRSQSPDGVEQEIWGLLLAYNLVRTYMERVPLRVFGGLSPSSPSCRHCASASSPPCASFVKSGIGRRIPDGGLRFDSRLCAGLAASPHAPSRRADESLRAPGAALTTKHTACRQNQNEQLPAQASTRPRSKKIGKRIKPAFAATRATAYALGNFPC